MSVVRISHILIAIGAILFWARSMSGQSLAPPPVNIDSLKNELAKDSLISQRVNSRKGYVAGVPASAQLDSARSGWSLEKLFERRTYVITGAGEILFTATVDSTEIPKSATETSAYTYLDHDSLTSIGTIWSRTYFLPTRSVKIELIPYGNAMHTYAEERDRIFRSFRWKPGANSNAIDVDPIKIPTTPDRPEPVKSGFGQ